MTNLKDELEKVLGDTAKAKQNTWKKMQQPKKKEVKPMLITIGAGILTALLLFIFLKPHFTQVATPIQEDEQSMTNGTEQDNEQVVAFKLQATGGLPFYVQQYESIQHVKTKEDYAKFMELYNLQESVEIDFTKSDALFVGFSSNGCGLEVTNLSKEQDHLQITLELPLPLRNQEDVVCTEILMTTIQLFQIEKIDFSTVTYKNGQNINPVPLNELQVDQLLMDFDKLFSSYYSQVEVSQNGPETSVQLLGEQNAVALKQLISESLLLQGIFDVEEPNYRLRFFNSENEQFNVSVWIDELNDSSVKLSTEHVSESMYKLDGEKAERFKAILGID